MAISPAVTRCHTRWHTLLVLALAGGWISPAQTASASLATNLDRLLSDAVQAHTIPGAVLVVGHNGQIIHRKAYGMRALVPSPEPMQTDTIFDAASLTKVVATTASLMKLFEQGRFRIDDPVTRYLPEFEGGKSDLTLRLLLTHFSGLPPDLDLEPRWSGYETGIHLALFAKPTVPAGTRFIYSDINFVLLGELVHRLSGKPLNEFARDEIFHPLRMNETLFLPPAALRPRIAPTEIDPDTGQPFRGVVHDPTARYMGGVAGHAGLFTTADDLGRYCQMLLNGGELDGVRLLSPATIRKWTEPGSPANQPILRGLGWDVDSPFSSNRGELFPIGSFGHTGFTGTSIWMDPGTRTYIVLLTNVVHPKRGTSLSSLRSRVATTVAAAVGLDMPQSVALTGYNETLVGAGIPATVARNGQTRTGLDVWEETGFRELTGKRVGLITNHTGLDAAGRRNIDVLRSAKVNLVAIYAPEHGLAGVADSDVADSRDPGTGIPVISLYETNRRRLQASQMAGLDALVFDIQDVGARFYTYSCTMLYALEEAGKAHKPFYVLDRPNPITGTHIEGPSMDQSLESFVGCYDLPLRHGLTLGELATMANAERHWNTDLHVIRMRNWSRGDWFDSTGLTWVDPSPNMRSLNAALLYPGIAMLEADAQYSVGRGTDAPFEQVGASWINGAGLAQLLNSRFIPGIRVYPTRFTPTASNFKGVAVEGVRFVITDRNAMDSTRLGVEVAAALIKLYGTKLDLSRCAALIGDRKVIDSLRSGKDPASIWMSMQEYAAQFAQRRKPFLLY